MIIWAVIENACQINQNTPENANVGSTIWIATGPNQGNFYTKTERHWISNRDADVYNYVLFRDEFSKISQTNLIVRDIDETRILEGWSREDFFEPGKVVVDLGSGQAVALLEYSQEFPQTIFIGIDSGYQITQTPNLKQPGVQLIKDNWNTLSSIPSNSVDTLISVQGGFTYSCEGDYDRTGTPKDLVKAITRVAKKGCIFLTDSFFTVDKHPKTIIPLSSFEERKIIQLFKQHSWDRIVLDKTAFFVFTQ